jgi:hypothetical protein
MPMREPLLAQCVVAYEMREEQSHLATMPGFTAASLDKGLYKIVI